MGSTISKRKRHRTTDGSVKNPQSSAASSSANSKSFSGANNQSLKDILEKGEDMLYSNTPAKKVSMADFEVLKVIGRGSFGKVLFSLTHQSGYVG